MKISCERAVDEMKGKGVSRDYSRRRILSGKRTTRSGKGQRSLDNIVVIDVDSDDEFDDVIIIDVPESLQQKLRGSSVVREGRSFPCIISIDDDDHECDTVEDHENNPQGDGNLDSDGTSSHSSPASDCIGKSVYRDADGFRVAEENRPVFKLRKCNRTYPEKAPSRNCCGLDSDSDSGSDLSGDSTSDCEVMQGSFGEVREQWEKASLKRKSRFCKGLDDQASPCSSHSDAHPNVEVENRSKQNPDPSACSSSKNVNFEKVNSCASTSARNGVLGGCSSSAKMGNPFANYNQKGDTFSRSRESRTDENIYFHWKRDDLYGGERFMDDNTISFNKFRTLNGLGTRFPPGPSWSNQEKDGKQYHHGGTCFQDMEKNTATEHSFPNDQSGPIMHSDDGKASVLNEDASLPDGHFLVEKHNVINSQADSKEEYKEFTPVPSSCKILSNEAQCREKFVSYAGLSEDKVVENVIAPSCTAQEVSDEKSCHQKIDERSSRENSSQCHSTPGRPGISNSAEGKEACTDFASSSQLHYEGELLCALPGACFPSAVRDIINDREKLKETEEYKQATEQEWAARQRQLKIQSEEAQRLRKRRKAETLRILDMERRQKQRVEEMRETQKKDEENLNIKERFRVEARKELYRLEVTCIDMASLLRALGIHVDGGFKPLPSQVHAAYKRALLKFHPDRASKTDIRRQVEAEEKFKLISRMKEKFLSTSCY